MSACLFISMSIYFHILTLYILGRVYRKSVTNTKSFALASVEAAMETMNKYEAQTFIAL